MLEKLNPAGYQKFMRAWLICSMISSKCAALFPGKLNHHNLQSSQRDLILQKTATQNLSKQKDRRKVRRPVISTQLLWSIDISRIFFANENPRKFVEKQNMIFFYIFHVYLDKRGRLPKERLPQKTFYPGGIFGQENFPPGDFCPEKPSLPRRPFFSKKISTSLEPLCNKEHPMTKHVVWGRVLTKQKSDTWWLF